jgi:hypothetical protein
MTWWLVGRLWLLLLLLLLLKYQPAVYPLRRKFLCA